ncbi:MAG: hypothetical protein ABJF23_01095 [Bryobacteraceae bacterium]
MASPSKIPDISVLREMNLSSIDVLSKSLQRLRELRPGAAISPMLQDSLEADISMLELELRISMIAQTRLQAANIKVKQLSAAEVQTLDSLASRIDETIERDAVVNASLGTVEDLIATATELRNLVKSSTEV